MVEVMLCFHKWEDPKCSSQLPATVQIAIITGRRFSNTHLAMPLNLIYLNFSHQRVLNLKEFSVIPVKETNVYELVIPHFFSLLICYLFGFGAKMYPDSCLFLHSLFQLEVAMFHISGHWYVRPNLMKFYC